MINSFFVMLVGYGSMQYKVRWWGHLAAVEGSRVRAQGAAPGGIQSKETAPGGIFSQGAASGVIQSKETAPVGIFSQQVSPGGLQGQEAAPGGIFSQGAAPGVIQSKKLLLEGYLVKELFLEWYKVRGFIKKVSSSSSCIFIFINFYFFFLGQLLCRTTRSCIIGAWVVSPSG